MNEPVSITICGTPSRETLGALIDLALSAGLGLALQPRPVVAPLQLPSASVEAIKLKKRRVLRKVKPAKKPAAAPESHPAAGRTYTQKDCVICKEPFTPSGPRSAVCDGCRDSFKTNESRAEERRRLARK